MINVYALAAVATYLLIGFIAASWYIKKNKTTISSMRVVEDFTGILLAWAFMAVGVIIVSVLTVISKMWTAMINKYTEYLTK